VSALTISSGWSGVAPRSSSTAEVVSEPVRATPTRKERGFVSMVRIRSTCACSPTPWTTYPSSSWIPRTTPGSVGLTRAAVQPAYHPSVVS
jgi:hypothetical protein